MEEQTAEETPDFSVEELLDIQKQKYEGKLYWVKDTNYLVKTPLDWRYFNEGHTKERLATAGFFFGLEAHAVGDALRALRYSFQRDFLVFVRDNWHVKAFGEVGMTHEGVYHWSGSDFLVTTSPEIIQPRKGEFSFIKDLINTLFPVRPGNPIAQSEYFHEWLRLGYQAVRDNKPSFGQVIVMCGPRGSGKSLLQTRIISPILGGRSAKSANFLKGTTAFNSDVVRADHLSLSDEGASGNRWDKDQFSAQVKQITVEHERRFEAKGRDSMTIESRHRLTISLNEEAKDLELIPELVSGIEDKIMVFRCGGKDFQGRSTDSINTQVRKELPHYLWWLLNGFKAKPAVTENAQARFGINCYRDKETLQVIFNLSKEQSVYETLVAFMKLNKEDFTGSAAEVYNEVIQAKCGDAIRDSVKGSRSLGTVLGNLKKQFPAFIKYNQDRGVWTLKSCRS